MTDLLAHSGGFGWDELVAVVLPVVVVLLLARRSRVRSEDREREDPDRGAPPG